jgi:hypothetical protein
MSRRMQSSIWDDPFYPRRVPWPSDVGLRSPLLGNNCARINCRWADCVAFRAPRGRSTDSISRIKTTRRHKSAMLASPRMPSSTIRIFSSPNTACGARRMSGMSGVSAPTGTNSIGSTLLILAATLLSMTVRRGRRFPRRRSAGRASLPDQKGAFIQLFHPPNSCA